MKNAGEHIPGLFNLSQPDGGQVKNPFPMLARKSPRADPGPGTGIRVLALALVPVCLEPLAVLVLAHLLPTLLDQRTHSGDLISTISGTGSGG